MIDDPKPAATGPSLARSAPQPLLATRPPAGRIRGRIARPLSASVARRPTPVAPPPDEETDHHRATCRLAGGCPSDDFD